MHYILHVVLSQIDFLTLIPFSIWNKNNVLNIKGGEKTVFMAEKNQAFMWKNSIQLIASTKSAPLAPLIFIYLFILSNSAHFSCTLSYAAGVLLNHFDAPLTCGGWACFIISI